MAGTVLGGLAAPAYAQQAPAPAPAAEAQAQAPTPAPAPPVARTVRSIRVTGNQRLEGETIRAYSNIATCRGTGAVPELACAIASGASTRVTC